MASGQPFLATWSATDQNLRLFRLAETGFVQVAVTQHSSPAGLGAKPYVKFVLDSAWLVGWQKTDGQSVSNILRLFDLSLTQKAATTGFPASASGVDVSIAVSPKTAAIRGNGNGTQSQGFVTPTGVLGNPGFIINSTLPTSFTTFSPDEEYLFYGRVGGVAATIHPKQSVSSVGTPVFTTAALISIDTTAIVTGGSFSNDSRFFYAIIPSENKIAVYERGTGNFKTTRVAEIQKTPLGTVYGVACRFDDRYIAVTYFNSSTTTYTTVVYKRVGTTFSEVATVPENFGQLLSFTRDGTLILDAALRKAYQFGANAVMTAAHQLMTNLPAGISIQDVSTHINAPLGSARLYNSGFEAFGNNTLDLSNLKLLLLNKNAGYNPEHSAVSQVTNAGANEVVGNGWAAGGVKLTNVTKAFSSPYEMAVKAADISQPIITADMTFRNALIYDATSLKPISFVEFVADYTVEKDTALKFNLSSSGFIRFTI